MNSLKNNYWYVNRKPIMCIIIILFLFFFCANLALNLIQFLTSKF